MSERRLRRHLWPLAAAVGAAALTLSATPAWAVSLQVTPATGTWGTNGRVSEVLALANGQKVIAGSFSAVVDPAGGSHAAANLALLDANGVWVSSWAGATDGPVSSLAAAGSTLYAGGTFTTAGGAAHRHLAAFDAGTGGVLSGFSASPNGKVLSLAATSSALFVGGSMTKVTTPTQGAVASQNMAKLNGVTGAVDTGWAVHPDGKVNSVVLSSDGTTVYLGGDFRAVGSYSRSWGAALGTTTPAVMRAYQVLNLSAPILKQAYYNGTLYAAANSSVNGGACVALNGTTGARIWGYGTDGNVQAVTAYDGFAYCGGHFAYIGSSSTVRHHVAAISLTYPYAVSSWNPVVNSALGVWAMTNDGSKLLIGGDFSKAGTKPRAHYAEFTP